MSSPNDPTVFDDFDTEVQCEEVYGDPLPDFDEMPEDDDFYFDAEGGITGDAQQMLGEIDREGGFV